MNHANHHSLLIYISGKGINLLLAPIALLVLPGILGETGYGRYSYWFGLISVYVVLLDLGTQPLLRRYLPQISAQHPKQARTLFNKTLIIKLLPVTLLLSSVFFKDDPEIFIYIIASSILAAITTSLTDIYYAYQHMGSHITAILIRRISRLILVPVFFILWDIKGILIALILTEVIAFLYSTAAYKLLKSGENRLEQSFMYYYQTGILVFIAFLISTLLGRLPILSYEWLGYSIEEVGRLALCIDLTYFALKELINAISESILPKLITYYSEGDHASFKKVILTNYRIVNFALLGALTLGISLAPSILPLLGDNFYLAAIDLQVLLIGVIFSNWNLIHNQILITIGNNKVIVLGQFAGLCAGILSFFFLHDKLAGTLVLSTSLLVSMCATAITTYPFTKIIIGQTNSFRYFIRIMPACFLVGSILHAWQPSGLWNTLYAIIFGVITYFLIALTFRGLSKEDIKLLKKSFKRKST